MCTSDLKQSSQLMLEETLEALRNKPIDSTYMERLVLSDRATDLYNELPQPLRLGISGYISKTEKALEMRLAEGAEKERLIYLQGMLLIYRAFRRYIIRYGEAAKVQGMTEAARICRNLADNPPATFREAIQLILFVTNTYLIHAALLNGTISCGRMDDLLASYYRRDVEEGILNREEAGYIIDDFNCKITLVLGRGEHQMSGGTDWFRNPMSDSPTYVILGGYSNRQNDQENPLTKLFLERIHPRLENPVYVFRRTKDVKEELWRLACDKMRQNASLIFYNDEVMIQAMQNVGVNEEDAREYTIHGCNWSDIQGKSLNETIGGSLPDLIMECLLDEEGKPRKSFSDMDALYEEIELHWRSYLREEYEKRRQAGTKQQLPKQLNCSDCFMRGAIEGASDIRSSVPYPFVLNQMLSVGTAADILAGIEQVVFGPDGVSLETMADALKADFVGYEKLRRRCQKAPKYGHDVDAADIHAARLLNMLTNVALQETINPRTGERDIYAPNVIKTDTFHIRNGKRVGATPDGRLVGQPFSENLSPSAGASESVTALLNSVVKLPFARIGNSVLNLRIPKTLVEGEEGLMRFMVLLQTYFERGGLQLQFSGADVAEMRDAQIHPEEHRDLMVRITGYSAVFVDMTRKAQDELIRHVEDK